MIKIEKRKYEINAVTALRKDLSEVSRVLAVSPTGSGKTVCAAMLIKAEPRWRKVLWLAHRYELVDQAYKTLTALGISAGILMAQEETLRKDDRVDPRARVQVASVQTIAARGVPAGVDLVVIDEAHRAMADSYLAIARECESANVLGLTATPCRADGRGLGEFFERMRIIAQPSDLHADKYLAKPRAFSAGSELLMALEASLGTGVRGGDFSHAEMSAAVDHKSLIGRVVEESMRIAPGVPKAVFACSVAHSKRIAEGFRAKGVSAAHLDAHTPPDERESILSDLASGAIEVVSNVDVLSEGWDLPELGAVILARPTKSFARYLQMVGRVQRYHGDRPFVIDHGGNIRRFDVLPGEDIRWSLDSGGDYGRDDSDPRLKECPCCSAMLEWTAYECSECGLEMEVEKTEREEREEIEAELEEITRAQLDSMRLRVEEMARVKNAPDGWAEKVYGALAR